VKAVKEERLYRIHYNKKMPWEKYTLQPQELCQVTDVQYKVEPPTVCSITLALLSSKKVTFSFK